jgi:hypothetical protein
MMLSKSQVTTVLATMVALAVVVRVPAAKKLVLGA